MGLGVSPNTLEKAERREEAPTRRGAGKVTWRWFQVAEKPQLEAGAAGGWRADARKGEEVGLRGRAGVVYLSRPGEGGVCALRKYTPTALESAKPGPAGGCLPPSARDVSPLRPPGRESPEEATPAAGRLTGGDRRPSETAPAPATPNILNLLSSPHKLRSPFRAASPTLYLPSYGAGLQARPSGSDFVLKP